VGQEAGVVGPEVLALEAKRVLVQVVLEPDEAWPAVLGVDHRAGELAVEPVDGARWEGPVDAGLDPATAVEGDGGLAVGVDGQHLRRGIRC